MENSLKGLILAAGTIITCLVISLGFFIAKEAKASATNGAGQISRLNSEFVDSDKIIYDNTQISGSEVINVINKYKNELIGIIVTTSRDTQNYSYNIDEISGNLLDLAVLGYSADMKVSDISYINPVARFNGTVIRDRNGAITGLRFKQV